MCAGSLSPSPPSAPMSPLCYSPDTHSGSCPPPPLWLPRRSERIVTGDKDAQWWPSWLGSSVIGWQLGVPVRSTRGPRDKRQTEVWIWTWTGAQRGRVTCADRDVERDLGAADVAVGAARTQRWLWGGTCSYEDRCRTEVAAGQDGGMDTHRLPRFLSAHTGTAGTGGPAGGPIPSSLQ